MKIILFANTPWYLYNFVSSLARELQQSDCEVLLLSPEGEFVELIKQAGFRHHAIPMRRREINLFYEHKTLFQLIRVLHREKPDLIHNFTSKCIGYGSLAAHLTGVPVIINSVTGLGYAYAGKQLNRLILRFFIELFYRFTLKGTAVIFQNKTDQIEFLKKRLVSVEQVFLVRGSGVDLEKFKNTPELQGVPLVLQAGRMLYDKGVEEFVNAARLLRSRNVNARFVLVGDPDPQNPASIPLGVLQEWHQEGIVEWWGWQTDMPAVYQQVHIVCLPSYYREGIPKTLLEAAASGRPIITTDSEGCREVVEPGRNGLLVPAHDPAALALAVETLLNNRNLRQSMGKAGREIAERDFKVQDVIAATRLVYDWKKQNPSLLTKI